MIAWGPGLIPAEKAGFHNETSVFSAIDLGPSMLAITGASAPEGVTFDGENVADTLLGKGTASRKASIFWRRPPDRKSSPGGALRDLAVREGNWKLLCDYDGTNIELYDLASDRAETTDVTEKHTEVARDLTSKLLSWHQSMPPDNGANYQADANKGPRRRRAGN